MRGVCAPWEEAEAKGGEAAAAVAEGDEAAATAVSRNTGSFLVVFLGVRDFDFGLLLASERYES